jgi:hypothetical protein
MHATSATAHSQSRLIELTDDQLGAVSGGIAPGFDPRASITVIRADVQRLITDFRNGAPLSTIRANFANLRAHLRPLLG